VLSKLGASSCHIDERIWMNHQGISLRSHRAFLDEIRT
jgi:hypothetical protein